MNLSVSFTDLPLIEREVAEMYALGLTKKEIANKRHRSLRTIENQLRVIFSKLSIRKDTELTAWYFCSRYKLTFKLSPLARQIIALSFFAIICLGIYNETSMLRASRSNSIARSIRGNRISRRNDFYI